VAGTSGRVAWLASGIARQGRKNQSCGVLDFLVRGAGLLAEQRRPRGGAVVVGPEDVGRDLRVGRAGAVVEHRHEEALSRDLRAAALAGEDRQRRRHAAAGAVAHHGDPVAVDAQLGGVVVQPAQRGVSVLERCGEGILRCPPVFDRQEGHAAGGDVARDGAVELLDVPKI